MVGGGGVIRGVCLHVRGSGRSLIIIEKKPTAGVADAEMVEALSTTCATCGDPAPHEEEDTVEEVPDGGDAANLQIVRKIVATPCIKRGRQGMWTFNQAAAGT